MNGNRDRRDLEIERPEAEVERLRERVAHSTAVVRQCLELYVAFNDRAPEAAAVKLEQAGEEAKSALSATRNFSMMLRRSETGGRLGKALSVPLETTAPPDVRYEVGVEGDEAAVPPHYFVGNQLLLILREADRNAVTHSGCKRVTVGLWGFPEGVAVEDDGLVFGVENGEVGDVGMRAMKERGALLGGARRVSSRPNADTKQEVSVPLAEEDVR
jgi:nitrate/nitrite-specific signal transduction histidine kinase